MEMGKDQSIWQHPETCSLVPHCSHIRIYTRSSEVHHFSQTDHLLIDSRHVSCLMDGRTHRCANVDSDNFLLASRIRARISNVKMVLGKKVEKYDYEKTTLQIEYKINSKNHLKELAITLMTALIVDGIR